MCEAERRLMRNIKYDQCSSLIVMLIVSMQLLFASIKWLKVLWKIKLFLCIVFEYDDTYGVGDYWHLTFWFKKVCLKVCYWSMSESTKMLRDYNKKKRCLENFVWLHMMQEEKMYTSWAFQTTWAFEELFT